MQDDALDAEGNMTASGKMKHMKYFDKKKPKDVSSTYSKNKEYQDEHIKEIQMSSINVTMRSKGLVVDESLLRPKIKKFRENIKKILTATLTTPKHNPTNIK